MSTDLSNEFAAFNAFVEVQTGRMRDGLSLEEALVEFRAYQRELADARIKVAEAKASSQRGETAELDIDQIVREVTAELATEGIHE